MSTAEAFHNASGDYTVEFQLLLNAIADAVCGLDTACRITFCNDTFLELTGYREDEMLGNSFHQLVHESILTGPQCQTNQCVFCNIPNQSRQLHVIGELLWRKDGTCFPGEYWLRPLPTSSGVTQSVVTIRDVSERKATEEKLRRTQFNLAESQRLTHIGSWSWRTNQRETVYWSDEHYRIFGMEPRDGDLGFEESLARIHPEDLTSFRELVRNSVAAKTRYETTIRIVLPDGSIRHVRGVGNPVVDDSGNVVEFVGTTTDITEQKQAEKELRLAQFSLEHASAAVHWINSNGRIVYVNERACAALEYCRKELLSLALPTVAPQITDETWKNFWDTIKSKGAISFESENKTKRGRVFPVEVNATYLAFDGQEYAFVFIRDITERKQIEQRLRTLSSAVDQSPASVVLTDIQGNIEYVNPKFSQLTGYSLEEAVGQNPRILKSGMQPAEVYRDLWSTVLAGGDWRGEFANKKKNGEIYWEAASIVPIKNPDGAITHLLAVKEDITERKRVEAAIRESEKRYRLLFERNLAGVFRATIEGRILECNPAAARILGYDSPEELLPLSASSLYHKDSDRHALISELKSKKSLTNREIRYRRKNGQLIPVIANFTLVEGDAGAGLMVEGTFVDITERIAAEQRAHSLAYFDPLTGLPNRTLLRDRLSQALATARRQRHKVALLFIDLDRFKIINDSLGHSVGDLLLQEVAKRLNKCVREQDTVARLGGDEFLIVLTHLQKVQDAAVVAERVMDEMTASLNIQGHALNVSCSLGISIFPDHGPDGETLVKNADAAMYRAKQTGRNNSQLFAPDMSAQAFERLKLENGLQTALDKQQLSLYYQPQLEIATGKITGLEALLRWRHPKLGVVPPSQFLPVAEHSGLIVPIGEWVLRTACSTARQWQIEGLLSPLIAVNVSAVQFRQDAFCRLIATVLHDTGLAPQYLQLELTESVLLANADLMLSVIRELKNMGVTLAIDDFGTGYSSFSYLRQLRVDKLKIDRVFIRDVAVNPDDAAITSAIISMAKSLKLKVTAEGVGNEEQLAFLRTHRCDEIQGNFLSGPLPADKIPDFLRIDPSFPAVRVQATEK
jgi:diguanylate cyclase (GGDEF)-like protein/PAS domain S-box-containing protein